MMQEMGSLSARGRCRGWKLWNLFLYRTALLIHFRQTDRQTEIATRNAVLYRGGQSSAFSTSYFELLLAAYALYITIRVTGRFWYDTATNGTPSIHSVAATTVVNVMHAGCGRFYPDLDMSRRKYTVYMLRSPFAVRNWSKIYYHVRLNWGL